MKCTIPTTLRRLMHQFESAIVPSWKSFREEPFFRRDLPSMKSERGRSLRRLKCAAFRNDSSNYYKCFVLGNDFEYGSEICGSSVDCGSEKMSCAVDDNSRTGKSAIWTVNEAVNHALGPGHCRTRNQLQDRAPAIRAAALRSGIEISRRVEGDGTDGTPPIRLF